MLPTLLFILSAPLALSLLYNFLFRRTPSRLPPGPVGWPLLGNLLDLPLSSLMFKKLTAWSKEHGPIYTFYIATRPVVVLNNAMVAADILDRMSLRSGDRPPQIKAGDYMTRGRLMAFMQRDTKWKTMRRAAHDSLSSRAVLNYDPLLTNEAHILVLGLLHHPQIVLQDHAHRFTTSSAVRILYGLDPVLLTEPDPAKPLSDVSDQIFQIVKPGKSVVDLFPPLKLVIDRWPFLRKTSDVWYEQVTALYTKFYWSEPSFSARRCISLNLREGKYKGLDTVDAAWLVGVLLLAAQDTTKAALRSFVLAMLLYPEVAKEAHTRLDVVVGSRPPMFDDAPRLSYIEAIVKEVLRWRPPAPTGLAHMASEDIFYDGYVIPKGTMIVGNIWAMSHDPQLYPDPERFDPSRFLTTAGSIRIPPPDTHEDLLAFGHGRRVCPGKDLVMRELWIACACILWAFHIQAPKDEEGKAIIPDADQFIDIGAVAGPAPFGVALTPRFANLQELLDLS